ncbi:response regulator transcription factor [Anaerolentibacter hominis]|uniref:response regulator transcription factor n=1 Tax=Anaerolentibacter hominis TaxID=3079009 RepID=UPI0031B892BF
MSKILIVEDDTPLREGLVYELGREGYLVQAVSAGLDVFPALSSEKYDLVILDVNLPDISGFDLCPRIRKICQVPVIFLTAKDLEEDEAAGFDLGADDYITKPFSTMVLKKRIQAVLKRSGAGGQNAFYQDGFLTLDFEQLKGSRNEDEFVLTPTEYRMLKLLAANPGKVMTRRVMMERLYDEQENYVDEHTLEVNINRLRKKFEDAQHKYIKTVYGMGYMWMGDGYRET